MNQISKKLKFIVTLMAVALSLGYCLDTSSNEDDNQNLIGLFALLQSQQNTNNSNSSSSSETPTCKGSDNGCRIFVTNSNYDGNLGGISGADQKCNSDSRKPTDRQTNYKAFLVGGDRTIRIENAESSYDVSNVNDWVLYSNQKYINRNGSNFATTLSDKPIFVNNASSPANRALVTNVNGIQDSLTDQDIWSGLLYGSSTISVGNTCDGWTTNSGSTNGVSGVSDPTYLQMLDNTSGVVCASSYRIICVEQ